MSVFLWYKHVQATPNEIIITSSKIQVWCKLLNGNELILSRLFLLEIVGCLLGTQWLHCQRRRQHFCIHWTVFFAYSFICSALVCSVCGLFPARGRVCWSHVRYFLCPCSCLFMSLFAVSIYALLLVFMLLLALFMFCFLYVLACDVRVPPALFMHVVFMSLLCSCCSPMLYLNQVAINDCLDRQCEW